MDTVLFQNPPLVFTNDFALPRKLELNGAALTLYNVAKTRFFPLLADVVKCDTDYIDSDLEISQNLGKPKI